MAWLNEFSFANERRRRYSGGADKHVGAYLTQKRTRRRALTGYWSALIFDNSLTLLCSLCIVGISLAMSRSSGSKAAPTPYIQTETGNIVSRQSLIYGSQNIVLSGKSILSPNCILRGDLRRTGSSSGSSGSGGAGGTVVIAMGKYCFVGESTVLRPCYKTYKG